MRPTAMPSWVASRWLICAALAAVVAACSTTPSASPLFIPTAPLTAPPTIEASASPQPSASPVPSVAPSLTHGVGTLDVFPPGAAVQVDVNTLNLRKNPSTSAKRLASLARGDVLVILPIDNMSFGYGPVKHNGYTWYAAIVTGFKNGTLPDLPTPVASGVGDTSTWGWVATDDGSRPYVTAIAPRCPGTVDLANVSGMLPAERIACFGAPISLSGTYGCPGCDGGAAGTYKPAWLAYPLSFDFLSVNAARQIGPLTVRFPSDGPTQPSVGSLVNVTVHVDDPRSTNCTMAEVAQSGAPVAIDRRTAFLLCRERLVIERIQVLGPDPSFPTF